MNKVETDDFIQNAERLRGRWLVTGLLRGIRKKYRQQIISVLFQNQYESETNANFGRIAIPLVRRVYTDDFIPWQIVNVQSVLSNNQSVVPAYYTLQAQWEDGIRSLDAETSIVTVLTESIRNEITNNIIEDLSNGCETTKNVKIENIWSEFIKLKNEINFNWILANKRVVSFLKEQVYFIESEIKLIEYNIPDVLIGCEEGFCSGYSYTPCVPFILNNRNIIHSCVRKLSNPRKYAKLIISN